MEPWAAAPREGEHAAEIHAQHLKARPAGRSLARPSLEAEVVSYQVQSSTPSVPSAGYFLYEKENKKFPKPSSVVRQEREGDTFTDSVGQL